MSKDALQIPLQRFASDRLGPAEGVERLGSAGGNAATYAWHGRDGTAVLKVYRAIRPFRQEVRAYREWLPSLVEVPKLLAVRERAPYALLLERLQGAPLAALGRDSAAAVHPHAAADSAVASGSEAEAEAHRRAGRWLRRLHSVPFEDRDPLSLRDAYAARWRRLMAPEARCAAVAADRLEWAWAQLREALPRIGSASRVPCHHDFEPRNWLVDHAGRWVGVVDFEHARPDHPLSDVARLAAYLWPRRPDLERAFWHGYRREPNPDVQAVIDAFAVSEAVQRLCWALEHRDGELAAAAEWALSERGAPAQG